MQAAFERVAVIGAGAMGAGIAQIAAQAGAHVHIHDVSPAALAACRERSFAAIESLAARGRFSADEAARIRGRLHFTGTLDALADAELVIEAIIEDEDAKTALFAQIEAIVGPDAVLATNTSALPIARLARGLARPERFLGMHFFNPPAVMKLVEVIAGPATQAAMSGRVSATAEAWGKVPVRVRDVPGFIVNRVARAFYAEAFTALTEAALPATAIDALFRAAGFRMGPLELTDLIGQDVNFAVARSVYDGYFGRTRFVPQQAQAALVHAGRLGRKTAQGIYSYPAGPEKMALLSRTDGIEPEHRAAAAALRETPGADIDCAGVRLARTRGLSARTESRRAGQPVALFDWLPEPGAGPAGFAASDELAAAAAERVLGAMGLAALRVRDRPGLIVIRTLAQIANAAADAALENVADEAGIDAALRHGANYPFGPFAWADQVGRDMLIHILDGVAEETGESMYRPSFYLRGAA